MPKEVSAISAATLTRRRVMLDIYCTSLTCKGSYIVSAREGATVICGKCGKHYKVSANMVHDETELAAKQELRDRRRKGGK